MLQTINCDYSKSMFLGSRNPFLGLFFGFDQIYAKLGTPVKNNPPFCDMLVTFKDGVT